tara:strand:+ start:5384 stop:5617 length:234 start_codon:yes stop_codon:yes gene_type:complete
MATKYTKSFNEYIKQWEDAAANSVSSGGVDMAPNAMGSKALLKRKKRVYDGRTKEGRKFVERMLARREKRESAKKTT